MNTFIAEYQTKYQAHYYQSIIGKYQFRYTELTFNYSWAQSVKKH